jgi:hypothetical protein
MMDITKVRNVIRIKNKAESRLASQAFGLGYKEEKVVDTRRLPERVIKDLQYFYECGYLDVEVVGDGKQESKVTNTENVKTEHGHEHTVFKPQQDKLINVQEIDTSGKSIKVGFSKVDAVELLEKHWKTLEKEVEKMTDVDNLKLLLATAVELDMVNNKKYEIVKSRIEKLQ